MRINTQMMSNYQNTDNQARIELFHMNEESSGHQYGQEKNNEKGESMTSEQPSGKMDKGHHDDTTPLSEVQDDKQIPIAPRLHPLNGVGAEAAAKDDSDNEEEEPRYVYGYQFLKDPSPEEWTSMNRSQRKRHREKKRRIESKEAFDLLMEVLLKTDSGFKQQARLREQQGANAIHRDENEGEYAVFNRIELINQTLSTLNRLKTENDAMRKIQETIKKGSPAIPSAEADDRTRSTKTTAIDLAKTTLVDDDQQKKKSASTISCLHNYTPPSDIPPSEPFTFMRHVRGITVGEGQAAPATLAPTEIHKDSASILAEETTRRRRLLASQCSLPQVGQHHANLPSQEEVEKILRELLARRSTNPQAFVSVPLVGVPPIANLNTPLLNTTGIRNPLSVEHNLLREGCQTERYCQKPSHSSFASDILRDNHNYNDSLSLSGTLMNDQMTFAATAARPSNNNYTEAEYKKLKNQHERSLLGASSVMRHTGIGRSIILNPATSATSAIQTRTDILASAPSLSANENTLKPSDDQEQHTHC